MGKSLTPNEKDGIGKFSRDVMKGNLTGQRSFFFVSIILSGIPRNPM